MTIRGPFAVILLVLLFASLSVNFLIGGFVVARISQPIAAGSASRAGSLVAAGCHQAKARQQIAGDLPPGAAVHFHGAPQVDFDDFDRGCGHFRRRLIRCFKGFRLSGFR